MGLYEQFPYTNFHELNLADLMETVKGLEEIIEQFDGDIDAAVAAYISLHPGIMITPDSVYTTALQDGAVTQDKLDPRLGIDYVTPQMFGAAGDGTTNDRDAFQAAINTGIDVYVPTANGEKYFIRGDAPAVVEGVKIPLPALRWPDNGCKRIFGSDSIWRTVGTSGAIIFEPYNDDSSYEQPLLRLEGSAHSVRISNLRFVRQKGYISGYDDDNNPIYATCGIAIDMAYDTSTKDKDSAIINSCANGFNVGLDFSGRGMQFQGNTFSANGNSLRVSWPSSMGDDEFENGSRGIMIQNNRFHVDLYSDIYVKSGHAYGMSVVGNYKDRRRSGGRTFIRADSQAVNWCISGNSLNGLYASGSSNLSTIELAGGALNCVITGNTFEGFPIDSGGNLHGPINAIDCSGGVVNGLVITGNSFKRIRERCLKIMGCDEFKGLVFSGNSCSMDSTGNLFGAVFLGTNDSADEIVITGNRMDLGASSARVYAKISSQPVPTHLVVDNNITI